MSYMLTYTWTDFIRENLAHLQRGGRAWAPDCLPHPRFVGFTALSFAEPDGQVEDWAHPLGEGRVHVHIGADGRMLVHLDRWDPDQSLASLVKHVLLETKTGKAIAIGASAAAAVWAVRRLSA